VRIDRPLAVLAHAVIHLLDDFQSFYTQPRIVTDQDSFWYGAAIDLAIEDLRRRLLQVQESPSHLPDPSRGNCHIIVAERSKKPTGCLPMNLDAFILRAVPPPRAPEEERRKKLIMGEQ
jgi:hypothetical protein